MAKVQVCKEANLEISALDFNETQKGKDQCDRDAAVAKRCIRSYVNIGKDVLNAEDIKEALDSTPSTLPNTKTSVVKVMPNDGSIDKARIDNITRYHYFKVEEDHFRVWEFHNIGTGVVVPIQDVSFHACLDCLKPFPKKFGSFKQNITGTNSKASEILCTNRDCIEVFTSEENLRQHLLSEKHSYLSKPEELKSSADRIKVLFSQKLREAKICGNVSVPYDSEQLDDSTDILQDTEVSDHLFEDGKKAGWASRKQKPVKRFTEKQIQFLVKIYDDGEKTKAKKDAVTFAEMMRTAVDENQMKLFSTSEYLRREQIASFFSRITASRRLGKHKGQSEVDDETEACVAEECLEELEANNEMEFVEETLQAIIVSREEELDKEDDEDDEDNIPLGYLSKGDIRESKDKESGDDEDNVPLGYLCEGSLREYKNKESANNEDNVPLQHFCKNIWRHPEDKDDEEDAEDDIPLQFFSKQSLKELSVKKKVNVYPDGRCLFRAVAVSMDPALIKCSRTIMGWPCNREIADKEAKEADGLRMNTVRVMYENKDLYASTSKEMGFTDIYDADFGTMEERLKEMKNPSVYADEPELLALVHLIEQPTEVYQPDDSTVMFGEAFLQSARKVNLIYAPEKTENRKKVPAHYDLLHNELYPGISDFVALRAGKQHGT